MPVTNRRLDLAGFLVQREEVLAGWTTGADVDITDAVAFHRSLPANKRFAQKLDEALASGTVLTQPRAGVALLDEHIALLEHLQDAGEADLLPTTIDSYTRQNRYCDAKRGIEESAREGRSLLNGFPAVNMGVAACRRIIETLKVPVQVRHGTPDARLLAEVTLAGGFTAFEGGGISYNIPYAKDVSLEKSISDWQYVDRLVGWYGEQGVIIDREPFGPLTGTMVIPSISHAIAVIEALLAAEQGVRHITLGYGQCGNLVQDVAAINTLAPLAKEYLDKLGYGDVTVATVLHQWMGGFPQDEARAFAVIAWGAATAAYAKATKVIVKTPHEAIGVPTKEANAAGLRVTKQVLSMLRDQTLPDTEELVEERGAIMMEARAMIDATFELGEGDLAAGVGRAFAAGVLDVPFAPSRLNAGMVMPARDDNGAVRLLECGNLPIPAEAKAFHRTKLAERARHESRDPSFQMVIDDIYAVSKGMLVGRPR